jgi:aryl-alcohol dehydrogenase-like predicted oxidoreductase
MATAAGTRSFLKKFPLCKSAVRSLAGFDVSAVGYGCYRVDDKDEQFEAAMKLAIRGGVNVIDTSANYRSGNSEVLVGKVVGDLISSNEISREEVVIVRYTDTS